MHNSFKFVVTMGLLFFYGGCDNPSTPKQSPAVIPPIEHHEKKVFDVIGSGIFIRSGPGKTFPKIINTKATEAFKKTMYAQIDGSTKVELFEQKNEWSKIQVVEPSWLRESHVGWVPSSCLKQPNIDNNGHKIYTENDIIWDKFTKPHKAIILAAINKIAREHPDGPKIDTASISVASNRGTKTDPVFFVTMGEFPKAYNIYFSKKDAKSELQATPSTQKGKD